MFVYLRALRSVLFVYLRVLKSVGTVCVCMYVCMYVCMRMFIYTYETWGVRSPYLSHVHLFIFCIEVSLFFGRIIQSLISYHYQTQLSIITSLKGFRV
jgi:hypothetical protein